MNSNGSQVLRLTREGANWDPIWSPDGRMIAFVSDRSESAQIFVMNADGTEQRQVTEGDSSVVPTWSPDGRKLAFCSKKSEGFDIYTINIDGTEKTRITYDPKKSTVHLLGLQMGN